MPIEITPLTSHIGARLTGIDARRPLTPAEVAAIDEGMNRHAVLVLPGQDITDEQQLVFTRNFGPLEEGANSTVRNSELRLAPAFADVSNLDKSGEKLARDNKRRMAALGNRLWHSDASFRVVPAKYSILSGRIVTTEGGNTEFADMRAAYDALDAATRAEIEGHPEIRVVHADEKTKVATGEVWHSDMSCEPEPPMGSILYLHQSPPVGGDWCR